MPLRLNTFCPSRLLGLLHQLLGQRPLLFAAALQRPDQGDIAQGGGGQGGEGGDGHRIDGIERPRLQRIQSQGADQLLIDIQGAAHAGMHFGVAFGIDGQPAIERIGQLAIVGKADGLTGGQDALQARVLLGPEPLTEQLGGQAVQRHRDQGSLLQLEQGDGIAG